MKPTKKSTIYTRLIRFLKEELAIPANSIAIAQRSLRETALQHEAHTPNLLPMVLWQYGLVTLEQLDKIFDWLETA